MKQIKDIALWFMLVGIAGHAQADFTIGDRAPIAAATFLNEFAARQGYVTQRTYPADCWQGKVTLAISAITAAVFFDTVYIKLFLLKNAIPKIEYKMAAHFSIFIFWITMYHGIDYALGKILYHGILRKKTMQEKQESTVHVG